VRRDQVKKFWAIYRSSDFKKEVRKLFNKVRLYGESAKLDQQYSRKVVGLVINKSSSFVTKSLNTYNLFIESFEKRKITPETKIEDLIIRAPKFRRLFYRLQESQLSVQDLFGCERFWELHVKGIGPKNFAYLLYCLEYHGLTIRKAKWCKK